MLVTALGCGPGDGSRVPATPAVGETTGGIAFTDVTETAGLAGFRHVTGAVGDKWFPETMGSGGGFVDVDGDGWLDVLLVGGGVWPAAEDSVPALRYYGNNGDGTFSDRTKEAGLSGLRAYGFGLTAADVENDGDVDLFVTTLAEDLLLRNDGGSFTEVGQAHGVAGGPAWSTSALFFDADHDGWVDLYVGRYVHWTPEEDVWCTLAERKSSCTPEVYEGLEGRYYHNDGDGTFTDRTEEAGFSPSPGKTLAVAEGDVNADGWSDLVVVNDTERDLLYVNRGNGRFDERGVVSGMAYDANGKARAGMGVDVGDIDGSGRASIFVGNFSKETIGVYRDVGNGLFVDRAAASRIGQPSMMSLTFGLFLFDGDLDGDLDLFVANGHIAEEIDLVDDGVSYRQPAQVFLNGGDGTFEPVPSRGALALPMVARGAAYGDYDQDGDLDVLITENGGPVHLWRNELSGGHAIQVRLDGRSSTRDGLGARVTVQAGSLRVTRRVRTGSSYLSQSETAVTFGLGDASRVDSVVVVWPSGRISRLADLASGMELTIVEGDTSFTAVAFQGAKR